MISILIAAALASQAPRPAAQPARREPQVSSSVASHDRQLELMARIKAEREAKAGKPAAPPAAARTPTSPSDLGPKRRLAAKKARYRAFQAKQDAREAIQARLDREEALRMLPYQLELNRQMTAAQTARYQADRRLQGDRAIANGMKGVTAPPY